MSTPRIATILDDGTYGERDMTPEEQAEWDTWIEQQVGTEKPEEF